MNARFDRSRDILLTDEASPVPLRTHLLNASYTFARRAAQLPGVSRIAVIGSLLTPKLQPKDADVLVTVDADLELGRLAHAGRQFKGRTQTRNCGADIFLANEAGRYLGRICGWRECAPGIRAACRAEHCGRVAYLNDDLWVVTLKPALVAEPPLELWPRLVRRVALPRDVEAVLGQGLPTDPRLSRAARVTPKQ